MRAQRELRRGPRAHEAARAGAVEADARTVVVTGCSSGIGLETARTIKRLGGDVLGVDVRRIDE